MVKCKDTLKKNYPRLFYRSNNLFSVVDSNRCNDTEKILNSFGIALRDTNREWRNTEEVIDEVAKKWSTFTDVEQSAIAVAISGKLLAQTYSNIWVYFYILELPYIGKSLTV